MKQALQDALDARGYDTLTPVQEAVLDPAHVGADLLVSAQTGSGKTLGFGLAIAPTLLGEAERFEAPGTPLALVIAPTRELALQVKRELAWLYAGAGGVMASCVGGMDMRDERRALDRGAHIVVATPGRLRDHIMRGSIDLGALRAVVLDEADEMLDLGFREDLEFILGEAPQDRQTLMFSATVSGMIAELAKSYQRDAVRVVTKSEAGQHADIAYRAMQVADQDADNAVINTLRYYEAPNAIVFGNTRAMVNRLTTRLSNRGFQVVALSGELSQAERTHALQAMRDGRAQVCVATDVAARGIDLPNLDLVIHAELPSNHETLLHRSGRTGRAGRKGVSALIVTRKSRKKAERILRDARLKAEWGDAPSAEEVLARDEQRMFADPGWDLPVEESEAATITRLVAEKSPRQLAAAFLRMLRAEHAAPEELSDASAPRTPRAAFGPSVWFAVPGGRATGAEPRRLLPMLCGAGGLSKEDVGAIRIQKDRSLVEIRESAVARFLDRIGPEFMLEEGVCVTRLDGPPSDTRAAGGTSRRPKRKQALGREKPDFMEPGDTTRHAKPQTRAENTSAEDRPVRASKPNSPKPADRNRAGTSRGRSTGGAAAPTRPESGLGGPKIGKPDRAKGPPPPRGKPNSKKNKARNSAKPGAGDTSRRMGKPRQKPGGKKR